MEFESWGVFGQFSEAEARRIFPLLGAGCPLCADGHGQHHGATAQRKPSKKAKRRERRKARRRGG
jgi:hypothetical protein